MSIVHNNEECLSFDMCIILRNHNIERTLLITKKRKSNEYNRIKRRIQSFYDAEVSYENLMFEVQGKIRIH